MSGFRKSSPFNFNLTVLVEMLQVAPKERQLATGGLVPLLQAIQVGIQEETHMQEGA